MNEPKECVKEGKWGWCRYLAIAFTSVLGYMAIRFNTEKRKMVAVAAAIALVWVWWYGYDYSCDQFIVCGVNVMTWSAWSLGLIAAGLTYMYFKDSGMGGWKRLSLTTVLWCTIMIAIEYIGYNYCKIQLKSNYDGLFGMPLMHGPWYLKTFYLTAWALYLTVLGVW